MCQWQLVEAFLNRNDVRQILSTYWESIPNF
jgi:hypothetical protein